MPKPYRPTIVRREMTSDSKKRKKIARQQITSLMSMGYRGNPNDRSERMYRKSTPNRSVFVQQTSSNRARRSPLRRMKKGNARAY